MTIEIYFILSSSQNPKIKNLNDNWNIATKKSIIFMSNFEDQVLDKENNQIGSHSNRIKDLLQ